MITAGIKMIDKAIFPKGLLSSGNIAQNNKRNNGIKAPAHPAALKLKDIKGCEKPMLIKAINIPHKETDKQRKKNIRQRGLFLFVKITNDPIMMLIIANKNSGIEIMGKGENII